MDFWYSKAKSTCCDDSFVLPQGVTESHKNTPDLPSKMYLAVLQNLHCLCEP